MTDIMLDIETLGVDAGAIVLSVGACAFDRATGDLTGSFHEHITTESCEAAGLRAEAGTALWWLSQNDDARRQVAKGQLMAARLESVADQFVEWFFDVADQATPIWSQGDMDFRVWDHAIRSVGLLPPWAFWMQRDTRTVYDVTGFDAKSVGRAGTYHKALDDAIHQVKCLRMALAHGGLI